MAKVELDQKTLTIFVTRMQTTESIIVMTVNKYPS